LKIIFWSGLVKVKIKFSVATSQGHVGTVEV
jgi:hypothetical protein